jgi:peptidoglycan/xylan/chitin deacetylase (PgdA/CDA1 family)
VPITERRDGRCDEPFDATGTSEVRGADQDPHDGGIVTRYVVTSSVMGVARNAMKVTAAAVDVVQRPAPGLVVLIYHRVGRRTAVEVDLPTSLFAEQMAYLTAHTRVVTLTDGLAALAAGDTDPMVAVTFDDGTADFADVAVPVLVEHRVPATLYVATDFVERGVAFPDDGAPISWSALEDTVSTGLVDVGSHTHHHALLDRLPTPEIDAELDRSIELIGERLDVHAAHFAYPKAVMGSAAADAAVRARFASAAVAGTRVNATGATDPYRLARSPVQLSDGMRWFRHKVAGGMAFEDTLRRTINRRRYAGATT